MADNTVLNAGAGGDTIATDDVLGVKYQQVKLVDGTLDSTTVVAVGNGTNGNALRVTLASDSTGAVAATQSGTWNVTNVSGTVSLPTGAATAAKQPAIGTAGTASTDVLTVQGIASMTALKVDGSGVTQPVSGTLNAAQSGTWTVQPGNTANTTAWLVQGVAGTTGGASFSGFVGAASNNKTQIKGSAGTLYFVSVQNLAATPVYLKVFDKTSANVTAGTTACDYQFMIPGNASGAGVVFNVNVGLAHANGITVMLTAAIGTTDNTSVSANNQVVTIGYK